jgi:hypothetical protein
MNALKTLVPAILCAALAATAATAQTGPIGAPNQNSPAVQNGNPGHAMSDQVLVEALRKLDPNLRITPGKNNVTYYTLNIRRNDWNYTVVLDVRPNVMWILSDFGPLKVNPNQLPQDLLFRMVDAQLKYGPTNFVFNKFDNGTFLTISHRVERGISLELFHRNLDEFLNAIRNSQPIWSAVQNYTPNNVGAAMPAPAAAQPAPATFGTSPAITPLTFAPK